MATGPCEHVGMLWARPVFSVGEATYTWADVAAFAQRGDSWDRLLAEIREGVACQQAGLVPDAAAVDAAGRAFRYERKLITADEMEAWLAQRSLDVRDWMGYLRRTVLRVEHGFGRSSSDEEVDQLVWVTGWCSGHFERMALDLAQRAAAQARLTGAAPKSLDELDDVIDRFRAEAVTGESIEAVVAGRRLDWLRVHLQEAVFDGEGAAREAILSMRYDELPMSEVCARAGARHAVRMARLEELDTPLRDAVLGAPEGEVVGPVAQDDGFVVALVESKTVPSIDDADVRDRAADAVAANALRHEVAERVRWHDR
jgi:hypothetical protein